MLSNKSILITGGNGSLDKKLVEKIYKESPKIRILELSRQYKVSRSTIIRDINKLKEYKLIKRIGSDKTGHWQINKEKPDKI